MAKTCKRIVITGGPGGGKTTAVDLFRRELGKKVVVVPEAATLLYSGGLKRSDNKVVRRQIQKTIFDVQKDLEEIYALQYPGRLLICDRGTIDGAAFWPGNSDEFFKNMGTTIEKELKRYDAVVFFETAAVGNLSIESGNPIRKETNQEAVILDRKLRKLWSKHSNFIFVKHSPSFVEKLNHGLLAMNAVVNC